MKSFRRIFVTAALALLFTLFCAAAYAETLELPAALTEIGDQAFYGDTSLENVYVPRGIRKIGAQAFANSSVKNIFLPENVEIADDAFAGTDLQWLVTPHDGATGRWAEAHGLPVAPGNNLRLHPHGGWFICAAPGERAELVIDYYDIAWNYQDGAHMDWFRVGTDARGNETRTDLNWHGMTLTTDPVYGHMEYICRVTDAFGLHWEQRFRIDNYPDSSSVSAAVSRQDNAIIGTQAIMDLSFSLTPETASADYCPGIAFSVDPESLQSLNDHGGFECHMWDMDSNLPDKAVVNMTVTQRLDELAPNRTYYYRAYLRVNGRVVAYDDEIKSFTTAPGTNMPTVSESASEKNLTWAEVPANMKKSYKFTPSRSGIYALVADRAIWELKVRDANADWINGGEETNIVYFAARANDPVYIFAADWSAASNIAVYFSSGYATTNTISAQFTEVGGHYAEMDVTLNVTEETAARGYLVGVAFSQFRENLDYNEEWGYSCDMWNWDGNWMSNPFVNGHVERTVDQLVCDKDYYFRPYIMVDGKVICQGDIISAHTQASVTRLALNTPTSGFSGDRMASFAFTAQQSGMYELSFNHPVDMSCLRNADGYWMIEMNGDSAMTFYMDEGDTRYIFVWGGGEQSYQATVRFQKAAPTVDAVDAALSAQDGALHASITMDVTPETAKAEQGYGYTIMISIYEDFQDENGNFSGDNLFWEDGNRRVRSQETLEPTYLRAVVPGMKIYYCGVIDYCNGERLHGPVHSFTVPAASVPAIAVNSGWHDVPADTSTLYSFTAPRADFYAIEAYGMHDFVIMNADGIVLRGINQVECEDRHAVLIAGFSKDETGYIRVTGDGSPRINIYPAQYASFALSSEPQWVYDNHFVRFDPPADGWYNVDFDNEYLIDNIGAYWSPDNEPLWLPLNGADKVSLHLEKGVPVYLITWYNEDWGQLYMSVSPADAPNADAVSGEVIANEVGSTYATFDLTYSTTPETLEAGYCVGLTFSQNRSNLEQLNSNNRFTGDDWRWEEMSSIANGQHVHRHIDQLIPDKTYYFRPVITVNKEVVAYGDIIELHTPAAKTAGVGEPEDDVDLITMRPYKEIKFSGDEVLPVIFTSKEENGFHVLNFSRPVGQADVRTADGSYYFNASNTESFTFYAAKGVPLYFFLRNWDEEASVTLSDTFIPAPTEDSIDASDVYLAEDGNRYVDVNVTITPETADKGYLYLVEISPDNFSNRINYLFRQGGDGKIRMNETDTRLVPPIVPGSKLYYRAAIWTQDGAYTGPTHEFTMPDYDVPALSLTYDWTNLTENTYYMYKFTATETGFYGVDVEGVDDCVISDGNGNPMRGLNKVEHDKREAFLLLGFEKGDTIYIRAKGDRNPRIRMVPENNGGSLNETPQWMWDGRFARCVVQTSGNYTVTVNRADLAGSMHLHRSVTDAEKLNFNGGTTATVYLEAGQLYHFIAWYDMKDMGPGTELMASVTLAN